MQRKLLTPLLVLTALTLAACASTPARFYTLSSPALPVSNLAQGATFIEMPLVSVPERFARPQIVVRADATRVDVLEQERWSSPFNSELRDALANGVANRLGAVDVTRGGRPSGQVPIYRIVVQLRQLEAVRAGSVDALFEWSVVRSDGRAENRSDKTKHAACRLAVSEAVQGAGIDAVVVAMQRSVDKVSAAIASDVQALREGKEVVCRS